MKNSILFSLLFLFTATYSQTYLVTYQSIPINKFKQDKEESGLTYILTYSDNKSVYYPIVKTEGEVSKIQFNDFSTNTQITQTSIFGEGLNISEKITPIGWTITGEKKQIDKLTCSLAQTKIKNEWGKEEDISACFDEKLPVKSGPENYFGLPGLIIEISTPKKKIEATEIKISKETIILKKPENKYPTLNREQYEQLLDEKMEAMTADMKIKEGVLIPSTSQNPQKSD